MKKLFLSALLTGLAATFMYAQPNSVLVYGALGLTSEKTDQDNKHISFGFNPGIGYQFDKHWTVGLTGSFNTIRQRRNTQRDWDFRNTYSAGVFVRHSFPINKIFFLFSQLEGGYLGSADGNTGVNATVNSNGFYASLTPAIGISVAHGLALNFGFGGINYETVKLSGATKSNSVFELTWGTQFNIGVSKNLYCGGKKYRRHKHKYMQHGMQLNRGSKVMKDDSYDDDDNEE